MTNISSNSVTTPHGVVTSYKLTNASGAYVELQSLGAGVRAICVPDRNGKLDDVALGYADLADYMSDGPCAGKTPGRFANRIALGKFSIDGKDYQLTINNGPNALHGGPTGFQNHIWDSEVIGDTVVFRLFSPDGDEHYPGNLNAEVTYRWDDDNRLAISYKATCDAPTVINLTNHTYFNLAGHNAGAEAMLKHDLQIFAENFLPKDRSAIPVGEYQSVEGTPFDFRKPHHIGDEIGSQMQQMVDDKGYDSSWPIDKWEPGKMKKAVVLSDECSGRVLEIETTHPAAHVYTGNWLAGSPINKSGRSYNDYDGVAIECQGMPDAPNKPKFPSQVLRPGEVYKHEIHFIFKTKL